MRHTILLSLGAAFCLGFANLSMNRSSTATPEADAGLPKESYVKVRVEVEARGLLKATDKEATLTARDRVYDLFNDQKEITDRVIATSYALDFGRSPKLLEQATDLNGLEVVVTGLSELRTVNTTTGVGAMSRPTWSLQRSILVTALKPVQ